MFCDYKLYYNDWCVLFTCNREQMKEKFTKVVDTPDKVEDFLKNTDFLFDLDAKGDILVIAEKPGEVMCQVLDTAEIIVAGGGIVFNENNELLMIHRRGKWDMPKGKIELKEKILDGAIREIKEETGVEIAHAEEKQITTYHTYIREGKKQIKQSEWFVMQAKPGQTQLKPQTEEDITEVRWVKRKDINDHHFGTYRLIWDLIKGYAE